MTEVADYSSWLGKTEDARDVVTGGPIERLRATLDHGSEQIEDGYELPPLAHWLYFLPAALQSSIGTDGHPRRGGFLPPVHELPRRMWAGSRITFAGPIRVGDRMVRKSTIASIKQKQGSAGPLVFVIARHEIGIEGQLPAIIDEHDIVYRGLEAPAVKASDQKGEVGHWSRELVPDAVMLFRYSALTFNGHRIHYDRQYVTEEEGYPGLIVHGPLIANLLLDLLRRELPGARVTSFSFKALSPLFDGKPMSVNASTPDAEGRVRLWAANFAGGLAMTAEASVI